ncbi:MAG TPA: hypothetical protein VFM74_04990 [Candidatus Limnocylindria bacterium]|nr:hypothetical protein [Candidatus Limnocylindria bacterium]
MQFSRAEGVITKVYDEPRGVHLVVYLELSRKVEVVRDARVDGDWDMGTPEALAWLADQLTQDTISNELALAGWEPIGTTERRPDGMTGDGVPRSTAYVLRRVG